MLPTMVTKCTKMHVLPKLAYVTTSFTSFDLWMFKCGIETPPFVINYFIESWEPMHVIVGLFEVNETIDLCMAQQF